MGNTATTRRSFLTGAIGLLVMSTAAPGAVLGRIVPEISEPRKGTVVATYTLRLRDYLELAAVGGSVKLVMPEQLGMNPDHASYGDPSQREIDERRGWYPIAVTRVAEEGESAFAAVSTYCTHGFGYQVADYNRETGQFVCPHNFSTFAADGRRLPIPGTPEVGDLRRFPTLFNMAEGTVTISEVLTGTTAVGAADDGIPSRLVLDQNFPNPFNPTTLIRYGLPAGMKVKLTVHTLLGNQVKVLVDETQDAGFHIFDLSAADLPSGAYFYRLQTPAGSLTRRMVISK